MTRRALAGLCGLVALGALWLPWFQPGENFIVLFGALDRVSETLSPTAWQAFGWEDGVLAGFAVATVVVAGAGRRWFLVPLAGALFTAGVLLAHRSVEPFREYEQAVGPGAAYSVPASEAGLVPLVAFAAATVALGAGRYRLRGR